MNKRGVVVFLFVFLFVLASTQVISAKEIKVKVTTYPEYKLNVNFIDTTDGIKLIKSYNLESGKNGEVEFTFTTRKLYFDISVFVMEGNTPVAKAKFEEVDATDSMELVVFKGDQNLIPDYDKVELEVVNETNETEEVNETVEEVNTTPETKGAELGNQDAENAPGITGRVTDNDTGNTSFFSSTALYFIIGLMVVGAVVFLGTQKLRVAKKTDYGNEEKPKEVKVKKLSEKLKEMKEGKKEKDGAEHYSRAIEDAEEKIKQAQKELDKLKNKEKIDALKEKIKSQQEELEKLEGKY